jgi:hypothetical protein
LDRYLWLLRRRRSGDGPRNDAGDELRTGREGQRRRRLLSCHGSNDGLRLDGRRDRGRVLYENLLLNPRRVLNKDLLLNSSRRVLNEDLLLNPRWILNEDLLLNSSRWILNEDLLLNSPRWVLNKDLLLNSR